MAYEEARSSDGSRRPEDDEFGELSIRKKDAGKSLAAMLTVGGIGLVLLTCVLGGGIIGAIVYFTNSTPAKLPGSWKGHFILPNGQRIDTTYTFRQDGTFREESFVNGGLQRNVATGRWTFRKGEIDISWDQGGFERGVVTWENRDAFHYRITGHTQGFQVGLTATFRRL